MNKFFFISLLFLLFAGSAFAQDFSSENVKRLLTGNSSMRWTMFKQFQGESDITSSMPICVLDNIFTFTSGGNFQVSEGKNKCDRNDPDELYSGIWSYNQDGKVISLMINGTKALEWQITNLADNVFILKVMNTGEMIYGMEMRLYVE